MISVDTKNRELIGNFKNKGRLWREAVDEVSTYDFRGDAECRATPYGIYDVAANRGHVCVGTSADTSAFAVRSIRDWWKRAGRARDTPATELLITADSGGSRACVPTDRQRILATAGRHTVQSAHNRVSMVSWISLS